MAYALITAAGMVAHVADEEFPVAPALTWRDLAGLDPLPQVGWSWDAEGFHAPPALPDPGPRYVPLSTIRERVTAAGQWTAFAAALDSLSTEQRWHLLTLADGVASDDAAAIALLTAIGLDPAEILA